MANARLMNMTATEYRAYPALNQSTLKAFAEDPQKFIGEERGRFQRATSRSMLFGSDFEQQVFYGKVPLIRIPQEVLNEQGHRRGKAWLEWSRQQAEAYPGVPLVTDEEYAERYDSVMLAYENLMRCGKAAAMLLDKSNVAYHQVIVWDDDETGVHCKCEIDAVHRMGHLIDLKTTAEHTPDGFNRQVYNLRYYVQAQWYRRAAKALLGEWLPFSFVAVKNQPGHGVEVYKMGQAWLTMGEEFIGQYLPRYMEARQTDRWQSATWNTVVELEPEVWMIRKGV